MGRGLAYVGKVSLEWPVDGCWGAEEDTSLLSLTEGFLGAEVLEGCVGVCQAEEHTRAWAGLGRWEAPLLHAFSCPPSGAPLLYLTQNQEDRHRCLCEGDPGRGLIDDGAPRSPDPLLGQCLPTPISYCHAGLGHSGRSRGGGPKCHRSRLSGPTGAPPVPLSCCSKDPGLAPHREGSWTCALPWPSPGCHLSCIFFYFLTEWTLRTLTQGGHISALSLVVQTWG